ncbi:MAG: cytochrome c553 [Gammaproteobacteria bacterium]|jgi:cytochrome c553
MRHLAVATFSSLLALASVAVQAEGGAKAGEAKAAVCTACHGIKGNSTNPDWPILAGQHAKYIVKQLKSFKAGTRKDPLMSGQAMTLSEEDMENLGAYFAAQTPK